MKPFGHIVSLISSMATSWCCAELPCEDVAVVKNVAVDLRMVVLLYMFEGQRIARRTVFFPISNVAIIDG